MNTVTVQLSAAVTPTATTLSSYSGSLTPNNEHTSVASHLKVAVLVVLTPTVFSHLPSAAPRSTKSFRFLTQIA